MTSEVNHSLQKASLMPKDNGVPKIEFMFNPTELTFEKIVETSDNKGSRTQDKGHAKVSFANTNPYRVTISKIVFDTYESGENVVRKYIEPFRRAVQFPDKFSESDTNSKSSGSSNLITGGDEKEKERTPLYTFQWGSQIHLSCCIVEKLTYKLTLFLPDGTPVRAVIETLSLKETAEPKPENSGQPIQPSPKLRKQQSMANRKKDKVSTAPRTRSKSSTTTRKK
jgi:Contractile injection system tube protein